MNLREKIITLVSACYPRHPFDVKTYPERHGHGQRAWIEYHGVDLNFGARDGHGETAEDALARLWERVQKEVRFRVAEEESSLRVFEREMDSAARNARVTTDRLATLRAAMRSTGATPREPDALQAAPVSPTAPARSKIAAVWGWCFGRKGTVQTEESVRGGKPWRHAWVDEDGQLARHGHGATDEEALADLWQRVQYDAECLRIDAEARREKVRQRVLADQQADADLSASLAEIDRILAEENGS